jgi:hypothetical protein
MMGLGGGWPVERAMEVTGRWQGEMKAILLPPTN